MTIPQHPLISEWCRHEIQNYHPERRDARLVMALPLWGASYAKCFLQYGLPSMAAPRNTRALHDNAEIIIYTDRPTYLTLLKEPLYGPLYVRMIPDDIMQAVIEHPLHKYSLLTAVHNIGIAQAARKGAGFSPGFADVVYSENYFGRLLELGKDHEAIAHLAFITSRKRAAADFRTCAKNLSARELGDIGWRHVSGLMQSWNVTSNNSFSEIPGTHFLVWRGRDSVRMHCPHLTPVWFGPTYCRRTPITMHDTLDALPMGKFYVPTPEDDMVLITLDDMREDRSPIVSFEEFRQRLRPYSSCMQQFKIPIVLPTLVADDMWLTADVIENRFQRLVTLLGI